LGHIFLNFTYTSHIMYSYVQIFKSCYSIQATEAGDQKSARRYKTVFW